MKKWKRWLAALLILTAWGCGAGKEPQPARVVTEITVICSGSASMTRRYFNTAEKMQLILQRIREIGLRDTPDMDPEPIRARLMHITLSFSDGSQKIYSQKGDRWFRENGNAWKEVDPVKGAQLYFAILLTKSDEEAPQVYRPRPNQLPGTGKIGV